MFTTANFSMGIFLSTFLYFEELAVEPHIDEMPQKLSCFWTHVVKMWFSKLDFELSVLKTESPSLSVYNLKVAIDEIFVASKWENSSHYLVTVKFMLWSMSPRFVHVHVNICTLCHNWIITDKKQGSIILLGAVSSTCVIDDLEQM